MTRPARRAWRNRAASLALAAAVVWLPRAVADDPLRAEVASVGFALVLAYGHLLGAWWMRLRAEPGRSRGWTLVQHLVALVVCLSLARPVIESPLLVGALLALSVWHTVENDFVLARRYGGGRAHLRPGRDRGRQLLALVATAAPVVPVAAGALPLSLDELFALVVVYHLASWLILVVERTRERTRSGARWAILGASHALPLALWIPPPGLQGTAAVLASPGVYLLFAALHVVSTTLARGRTSAPAAVDSGGNG